MQTTQNRLATGKKVNSALDNPLNFFTSSSLGARANDLNGLLDSMSNGIQTIQTANNGLTAITSLVQQLQATVAQARSDASSGTVAATPGTDTAAANTSTQTNNEMTFDIGGGVTVAISTFTHTNATVSTVTSSGAVGTSTAAAGLAFSINDGGGADAITFASTDTTVALKAAKINTQLTAAGSTVSASVVGGELRLTNSTGATITVTANAAAETDLGITTGTVSTDGAIETNVALTNAQLATAINASAQLAGKVSASEAAGVLTLNNLSTTTAVTVTGFDSTNVTGAVADSTVIAAGSGGTISNVRQSLLTQFNSLLTQIDTTSTDSGYNGVNLLNGDTLKLSFNETGTSSVDIQTKDANGASFAITSANLSLTAGTAAQFGDNTQLDTLTSTLGDALTTLRTQASALGSSLSVVQTRQDFTKSMINSLQTGADNLVLADSNQEGANLLALQTRQSLSTTALSLSAQADQAVLSLFG
jgi:flagellin-like hook-associated protein FlgL